MGKAEGLQTHLCSVGSSRDLSPTQSRELLLGSLPLHWFIPPDAPGSAKGTVEFLGFSFPDMDAAPSLWPPSCLKAGSSCADRWERSRIHGGLIWTDGYLGMHIHVSSFPSSPPSILFSHRALPTRGRRKAPRATPLPR